jgi:uncharacterized protein
MAVMRRKDKEITDKKELEDILQQSLVCRVGFLDKKKPYIVPLNFGYMEGVLYFHCATKGKKIDCMKKNNTVCFEVDCGHDIHNTGIPCHWSSTYQSIIGYGTASLVKESVEKKEALRILIQHYAPGTNHDFTDKEAGLVTVFKIVITSMTGKKSL